jgi:hypothetical protein
MLITPAQAIEDENLLGRWFMGWSWNRHKAILKAAYGERLNRMEYSLFKAVAGGREPPTRPVKELWIIAGRRAGKDSTASAIATVMAMSDYTRYLRPGEVATIVCLAIDKYQAKIVLGYIKGYFASNPLLSPLVERETEFGLELNNGIEIMVLSNNYRAIRGRTILCVILDEVALWRNEDSLLPDIETYTAIVPSLVTIPGSILIGISTAYRRAGLLFDKFRDHFGQNDPDVLVIKATTRQLNPTITEEFIAQQLERDYDSAAAEWLSEWRSDLADFVAREVVEAAVVLGCHELPREPRYHYHAFTDPSGGSSDSFTLAIAHKQDDKAILDCLREVRPPFTPSSVVEEFAATLKAYRISKVTGDHYAGEWPREQFRKCGIVYLPADKSKSDLYREALPALNNRKIALLDNPRLVSQLCRLERRTSRGTGKDTIDHPPADHDDVANAACGALVLAATKTAPTINPEVLARSAMITTNHSLDRLSNNNPYRF